MELNCVQFVHCMHILIYLMMELSQTHTMHMNRPTKNKIKRVKREREREHLSYMQNSDTNNPKPIFSTSFRTLSVFFTVTVYLAVSRLCVCVCFYAKHYFSFAWHSIYYSAINGLNMISIFERGSQCFFFLLAFVWKLFEMMNGMY